MYNGNNFKCHWGGEMMVSYDVSATPTTEKYSRHRTQSTLGMLQIYVESLKGSSLVKN